MVQTPVVVVVVDVALVARFSATLYAVLGGDGDVLRCITFSATTRHAFGVTRIMLRVCCAQHDVPACMHVLADIQRYAQVPMEGCTHSGDQDT